MESYRNPVAGVLFCQHVLSMHVCPSLMGKGARPDQCFTTPYSRSCEMAQGRLMKVYDDLFGYFDQVVAQVLLSRGDIAQVCRNCVSYHLYI